MMSQPKTASPSLHSNNNNLKNQQKQNAVLMREEKV